MAITTTCIIPQAALASPVTIRIVNNRQHTNGFTIEKVDEAGKALEGAGFTLYAEDGTTMVLEEQFTELPNARLSFNRLPAGMYVLKETTVSNGYTASQTIWNIEIISDELVMIGNAAGTMRELTSDYRITNTRKSDKIVLPDTGDAWGLALSALLLAVPGCALAYCLMMR